MKALKIAIITGLLIVGSSINTYASDWDVAGKVLTGIEAVRILTGGNVDIVGSITGINNRGYGYRDHSRGNYQYHSNYYQPSRHYVHACDNSCRRWVPYIVVEREWVPAHYEYDHALRRQIYVSGHYTEYRIDKGYWVYDCPYSRGRSRHR